MTSRMQTFLEEVDVPVEVKTVFFMIGYCHFCVLQTERSLKRALGTAFAVQDLQAEETSNQKRPFGNLLAKLKARVELDDDLELLINQFLKNRNIFTHHLTETIPFGTPEGLTDVANFCQELSIQARRVGSHFNAAIRSNNTQWMPHELDPEEVDVLSPLVNLLFRPRAERP